MARVSPGVGRVRVVGRAPAVGVVVRGGAVAPVVVLPVVIAAATDPSAAAAHDQGAEQQQCAAAQCAGHADPEATGPGRQLAGGLPLADHPQDRETEYHQARDGDQRPRTQGNSDQGQQGGERHGQEDGAEERGAVAGDAVEEVFDPHVAAVTAVVPGTEGAPYGGRRSGEGDQRPQNVAHHGRRLASSRPVILRDRRYAGPSALAREVRLREVRLREVRPREVCGGEMRPWA